MLEFYKNLKTTKNNYINIIDSKYRHMKLNYMPHELDIIFIGSSKTYYHISTALFADNNIKSYNLAMTACLPLSFPNMIANAIDMKPAYIVLGIDLDYFYNDFEPRIPTPGLRDIQAQIATGLSRDIVFRASVGYLRNSIPLEKYSLTLLRRMKIVFNRYTDSYFEAPGVEHQTLVSVSSENSDDGPIADSKIIAVQKLSNDFYAVKCMNGDGILFGTSLKEIPAHKNDDLGLSPNQEKIKFINYLLDEIRGNNIKPIVFLCPRLNDINDYSARISELRRIIKSPIIDMTNSIPAEVKYWADVDPHLNNKGRLLFSKLLLEEINKIKLGK